MAIFVDGFAPEEESYGPLTRHANSSGKGDSITPVAGLILLGTVTAGCCTIY